MSVIDDARAWLAQDEDPETHAELTALIADAEAGEQYAVNELTDRFGARLAFGTAGLRGQLGAGPTRMNRVLVQQAAAGLAHFLLERVAAGTAPSVVVGYDGRKNSDVFARDSAEIFAGLGLRAILLPRLLPTPVLAFALRELGADAGVMVTASHNPPQDNGYKVYLGGADQGAQIVPPSDSAIASHIESVAREQNVRDLPRGSFETADEAVVQAYITKTAATAPAPADAPDLTWVYTALHGVGFETLSEIVAEAGYSAPRAVEQQNEPDGAFPTVAFPNPEEPGAMDLAFAAASDIDAEFILANDPDADRLAVAIPTENGQWRQLTGNEVGLLLGWRGAQNADSGTLACSLVSSPGLEAIAEHYGLSFAATLTGFKWISRAPDLVYGFEEALGYLVDPEVVRDKDGISAALAMLELIATARARGNTLADVLTEFEETFGYFRSTQISVRVDDLSVIGRTMTSLRESPPLAVGDVAIDRTDDLLHGTEELPPGDVLRFWLSDGSRVIVRPSGTEPKIKVYVDVRGTSAADADALLRQTAAGVGPLLGQE